MRLQRIALLLIVSVCRAQVGGAQATPSPSSDTARQDLPASPEGYLMLPAGTVIPLSLVSPILKKSSKPGSPARATVAFPVTVAGQLAIPAGAYVEGTIDSIAPRAKNTHLPQVKIHFSRLLFANGYSVPLDAISTQAALGSPNDAPPASNNDRAAPAASVSGGESFVSQQPTLQPPPPLGPSPAVIAGAAIGGTAAVTAVLLLLHHRAHSGDDFVLLDAGWQFQMTTNTALQLNMAEVQAAIKAQ